MEKLVEQIKHLQRSSAKGKKTWIDYCNEELEGVCDPNRHEAATLETFLEWWAAESGVETFQPPPSELVKKIKQLQRSGAKGKQAWIDYCDKELGGVHDPSRHEARTLETFLESWAAESGTSAVDAPPSKLVETIKLLQRSSTKGKQAWIDYCDKELGGVHDPSRHEARTLEGFLEWWAAESGTPAIEAPPSELVEKIKNLQRSSAAGKQAWIDHCDQELEGVKDPSLHSASILNSFLEWWATEAGDGPDAKEAKGTLVAAPPMKPSDFIRQGARLSSDFKAGWMVYCQEHGHGFSDPAKYDEAFLSEFAEYTGKLIQADLGNSSRAALAGRVSQKRSASVEAADEPATKRKIVVKKSIADEIRRLNDEAGFSVPIRLGAVAQPLSGLDVSTAMEVFASMLDAGEIGDPNDFICNEVERRLAEDRMPAFE